MTPRVSVVCPTFNRSTAILDTLASVHRQTFEDWELLVVSDGSTDDTDEQVRSAARADPRIQLLRTARHGHPSGPRNIGLAAATGELIAYLDHDDRWRHDHLEVAIAALAGGADAVATGFERRDANGTALLTTVALAMYWHPVVQLITPLFEPSRVVHRAGLAERAGGWRIGPGLEDWDLWVRMTDLGARFTTVLAPTVTLMSAPTSRMSSVRRPHRATLVTFPDAATARDRLADLWVPDRHDILRAAARADRAAWYHRFAPVLRPPAGWDGTLDDALAAAPDTEDAAWADLIVAPFGRAAQIALRLWCATATHATRIAALMPELAPRQIALLRGAHLPTDSIPVSPLERNAV